MLWYFNKNEKARDEIIFGEYDPKAYMGGIRRFDGLSVEKLKELVELEYLDPDDFKNAAPTAEIIIAFMEKYPGYTAMGFAISVRCDNYRVIVDGIKKDSGASTAAELEDFKATFGDADEFTANGEKMYCWFD